MTSTLNLTEVDAAAGAFDVDTRVERTLFKLLDERTDGAVGIDPEILRSAGVKITEAAEKLLGVLGVVDDDTTR